MEYTTEEKRKLTVPSISSMATTLIASGGLKKQELCTLWRVKKLIFILHTEKNAEIAKCLVRSYTREHKTAKLLVIFVQFSDNTGADLGEGAADTYQSLSNFFRLSGAN